MPAFAKVELAGAIGDDSRRATVGGATIELDYEVVVRPEGIDGVGTDWSIELRQLEIGVLAQS
jgi:hypothetical protein